MIHFKRFAPSIALALGSEASRPVESAALTSFFPAKLSAQSQAFPIVKICFSLLRCTAVSRGALA